MKVFRILTLIALLAGLTTLAAANAAACPDGDPDPPLIPPVSHQVSSDSVTADLTTGDLAAPGALTAVDFTVPAPVTVDPLPFLEPSEAPPAFDALPVRVRFQDPSDVSCGVQALGMALEGLGGGAPTSDAITGFLQGNGMMYDFGTGVEELALAAHAFGYTGSLPFYGWTLEDLKSELDAGHPVVATLGLGREGQPGHFVTVTGISHDGKWASYHDPTLGKQVVRTEDFLAGWALQGNSGVQVAVAPPPEAGPIDYTPWVAFAAIVMALVSQTPLWKYRKGIGGYLDPGYGAGSTSSSKSSSKSYASKKVTTSKSSSKPISKSTKSVKVVATNKKSNTQTPKAPSKPVIVPDPKEELSILKPQPLKMPAIIVDEPPKLSLQDQKLTKFEEQYLDPEIPEPISPEIPKYDNSLGTGGKDVDPEADFKAALQTQGIPLTTIGPPFYDPNALENLSIGGSMTFGATPFSQIKGNPNDEKVQFKGISPSLVIQTFHIISAVAQYFANVKYLEERTPNVDLRVYYSMHPSGMNVPGMTIRNTSDETIVVSRVKIDEWKETYPYLPPTPETYAHFVEEIVRPDKTSMIFLPNPNGGLYEGEWVDVKIVAFSLAEDPQWQSIGWRINKDGSTEMLPSGW